MQSIEYGVLLLTFFQHNNVHTSIIQVHKAHSTVTGSVGEIQHASFLSKDIGSLYLNDDYADVKLVVTSDGGRADFMAHKVILACRSNYFQSVFLALLRFVHGSFG